MATGAGQALFIQLSHLQTANLSPEKLPALRMAESREEMLIHRSTTGVTEELALIPKKGEGSNIPEAETTCPLQDIFCPLLPHPGILFPGSKHC